MKKQKLFIQGLDKEITFYIGKNQNDNFKVIDQGKDNDLWFHANSISSCHVVAILPDDIEKNGLRYIIKMGAILCKNNTSKLKTMNNVEIIYCPIKNIEKTEITGCVKPLNPKTIVI